MDKLELEKWAEGWKVAVAQLKETHPMSPTANTIEIVVESLERLIHAASSEVKEP